MLVTRRRRTSAAVTLVRAVAQLHDPAAMRLWLRVKHLVLASFVGPTAALIALVIGAVQHRLHRRRRHGHCVAVSAARSLERRSVGRALAALSPAEAGLAMAAPYGLAGSLAPLGSACLPSLHESCR